MQPFRHREPRTPRDFGRSGVPAGSSLVKWAVALALVCIAGESCAQPSRPRISLEYAVKATYLYKLAPFVNWPPQTFTAANAPFRICVVGVDPFDDYLEKAVTGRSFGTHPFVVRHMESLASGTNCQIVFISHLQSQSIDQALDAVRGEPVLTVTDSTAEPDSGSIMQFVVEHGRVRFEVNTTEAARNHLTISSKLLNLAIAVEAEH
ncbi:MAG: YfiR family protein [Rhodanobacteraceae bacterium]